jgi:hypothetical protein
MERQDLIVMNLEGDMPKVKISAVTVAHEFDDESASETVISCGRFDDGDGYVSLKDDGDIVYLRVESWPEIRDQIQMMFDGIGKEDS